MACSHEAAPSLGFVAGTEQSHWRSPSGVCRPEQARAGSLRHGPRQQWQKEEPSLGSVAEDSPGQQQ